MKESEAARNTSGEAPFLARFTFYTLVSSLADFVFGAVFVTVLIGRGADPWAVGMILGGANLVGLLMEAPSGALGDRYGHRGLLVAGLSVWGAGFVVMGSAGSLPLTLAGMCLGTVGLAMQSGTLGAIMVNRIDSRERTARISRTVRIGAVSSRIGSALGAASVMVAGTWLSAGALVAVGGVLLLVLAVLAPLCFPATQGQPDRRIGTIVLESVVVMATRRFAPLVALAVAGSALVLIRLFPESAEFTRVPLGQEKEKGNESKEGGAT